LQVAVSQLFQFDCLSCCRAMVKRLSDLGTDDIRALLRVSKKRTRTLERLIHSRKKNTCATTEGSDYQAVDTPRTLSPSPCLHEFHTTSAEGPRDNGEMVSKCIKCGAVR